MMQAENGDVPLCLNCYERLQAIHDRELETHERHLNYLAAQFDNAVGIGGAVPRYPPRRQAPAQVRGTFNTINIQGSTVGVANIGLLRQVDTAITTIGGGPDRELAEALKTLAEAIAVGNIDDARRVEVLELLAGLSEEGTRPQAERRRGVAAPLLRRLREALSVSADLAAIAQPLWPVIAAAFGLPAN